MNRLPGRPVLDCTGPAALFVAAHFLQRRPRSFSRPHHKAAQGRTHSKTLARGSWPRFASKLLEPPLPMNQPPLEGIASSMP